MNLDILEMFKFIYEREGFNKREADFMIWLESQRGKSLDDPFLSPKELMELNLKEATEENWRKYWLDIIQKNYGFKNLDKIKKISIPDGDLKNLEVFREKVRSRLEKIEKLDMENG